MQYRQHYFQPRFSIRTILTIFLFTCLLLNRGWSKTYFVDNTAGNDAFSGTSMDSPWKTIAHINQTKFDPGDIILFRRGQVWKEQLNILSDGSLGKPIVFGSFGSGAKPIISARDAIPNGLVSSSWENASSNIWSINMDRNPVRLWLSGSEYGKAPNAESLNTDSNWYYDSQNKQLLIFSAQNPAAVFTSIESATHRNKGVVIKQADFITMQTLDIRGGYIASIEVNGSSHFCIKDCEIGRDSGKFGLYALNNNSDQVCDNGKIYRCTIDSGLRIKYDYSYTAVLDGVKLMNGCNNWLIHENKIMDWGHSGIQIENTEPGRTTSHNEIYDNVISAKNTAYCRGFEVAGPENQCSHNRIYRNIIKDTSVRNQVLGNRNSIYYNIIHSTKNVSYRQDGTAQAISFDGYGHNACKDNELFNNVIYNCEEPGIRFSDASRARQGNKIINNIVYNCGINSKDGLSGISVIIPDNDNIKSNVFLNNSFFNLYNGSTIAYHGKRLAVSHFNLLTDNHGDVINNNIQADPKFISLVTFDFKLKISSPCIDAGIDVGLFNDFAKSKVPAGLNVDIGAFELSDKIPPAAPSGFKFRNDKTERLR